MATTSSHLVSDKVNLVELKDWLRREFISFFEDCSGKKCIIWDNQLTQPSGLIADYKVLKERGVEKMMDLRQMNPLKYKDIENISHVFFVVKPNMELMTLIADTIHSLEQEGRSENKEYHILFVPRRTHLCEKKLKELGVYGSFRNNLKEFFLDLIPLEYDTLSMENAEIFRDCFLYNDHTYLYHISKSIMTLQTLYGIIPNIYGKGKFSKVLINTFFFLIYL
jgi:vacuolar protein sorting-associated protein 33A